MNEETAFIDKYPHWNPSTLIPEIVELTIECPRVSIHEFEYEGENGEKNSLSVRLYWNESIPYSNYEEPKTQTFYS